MIRKIDIINPKLVDEVYSIQKFPEIEAKIIDFYDIPPLRDTAENNRRPVLTFLKKEL
ncbi:hypothetical protein [Pseudogracilibacillus sp. SO30301A]|uniref:hypothetical protein n=1 Tax=Pseudogracilibacillus sp. SO30301A TaxID=3098291 RepID=UPI00300DCD2B